MPRVDQPFIRIPWSFDEHAKTEELSDAAYRAFISAITFCARNGTDGALTAAQARKRFTPKVLRELIAAPFLYVTEGGYQLHEYGEHQMTTTTQADLREKRAAAGAAGGKAKAERQRAASSAAAPDVASAVASASPEPKQILAEVELEEELELQLPTTTPLPPAPRGASRRAARTRVPEGWVPDPDMIRWARDHCPQITPEQLDLFHRRFMDHWENAPAKTGTKSNWLRTWQNWIETDYARLPVARNSGAAAGAARPNRATERLSEDQAKVARLAAAGRTAAPINPFATAPRQIGIAR